MGIQYVLTDIDGTLTAGDGARVVERSVLSHFQAIAGRDVVPPCDQCISKSFAKYGIDTETFTRNLLADLAGETVLRRDAADFLRSCRRAGRSLYTATTNSKYIALLKLAMGGITEEDFSGFFGGDAFGDPLGKGSPDFFPSILKAIGSTGDDVAMIGDDVKYDLLPALRAGIRLVIMVDVKQEQPVCFKDGAYFVNSLDHAGAILENAL